MKYISLFYLRIKKCLDKFFTKAASNLYFLTLQLILSCPSLPNTRYDSYANFYFIFITVKLAN